MLPSPTFDENSNSPSVQYAACRLSAKLDSDYSGPGRYPPNFSNLPYPGYNASKFSYFQCLKILTITREI